ncbi:glycosyltransferase [Nocardioides sp. GY 10113]|uniref:glycosyltransferase n=1 Tax=Nocardioides sp. GY 10113 TaxID=2569761 RepID=UPI001458C33A|nr:glycosyltransferase [Nocardioides sp. GY 10113]
MVYCAGAEWHKFKATDRHLVERLAERVDVLWVDPPNSVLRTLGRAPGEGSRFTDDLDEVAPGVWRLRVVAPPLASRPFVRSVSLRISRRAVARALDRLERGPHAAVLSCPEPIYVAPAGAVQVYFATDDFVAGAELMGRSARRLAWAERRQLARADVVAAVTRGLVDRFDIRPGTVRLALPNGCDARRFAATDEAPLPPMPLAPPVAGLVGHLNARIDLALLEATADRGVRLLLVGPVDPAVDPERFRALVDRPNVHWAGPQPTERLPSYLRAMGVGLTPYVDTAFNRASFPLKTLEYLAAGRPVVSTPLDAVEEIGSSEVRVASGPEAFAEAVVQALAGGMDADRVAGRRATAAAHDWGVRADSLLAAIDAAAAESPGVRPAGR